MAYLNANVTHQTVEFVKFFPNSSHYSEDIESLDRSDKEIARIAPPQAFAFIRYKRTLYHIVLDNGSQRDAESKPMQHSSRTYIGIEEFTPDQYMEAHPLDIVTGRELDSGEFDRVVTTRDRQRRVVKPDEKIVILAGQTAETSTNRPWYSQAGDAHD